MLPSIRREILLAIQLSVRLIDRIQMPRSQTVPTCEVTLVDHAKVRRAREQLPNNRRLRNLADIFKVLSDPMRLRIILALQGTELCVCDLASLFGVTRPAISHHLRRLREVRLVKYRRDGKLVHYTLDDHHIEQLIGVATEHVIEAGEASDGRTLSRRSSQSSRIRNSQQKGKSGT